jgi:hypothetical protein
MSELKNVWNKDLMDTKLDELASAYDPAVAKWIKSVGKKHLLTDGSCFRKLSISDVSKLYLTNPWMLKAYPRGTSIWEFDEHDSDIQRFKEDIDHAVITLEAARLTGTKDLNTVAWDNAVHEGVKAMERTKVEEKLHESEQDKTLIHRYSNGFSWWMLKSPRALRNESNHMGHCVGNENLSYGRRVAEGEIQIMSLRDASNEPHVTIEYLPAPARLVQLKGKANKGVAPKYRSACIGFLKNMIAEGKLRNVYVRDMEMSNITEQDLGVKIDEHGNVSAA